MIINDYGIGMYSEDINSIGPFKQFEKLKYQQIGNGLGLSIIKNMLFIIGGEIKIVSKKQKFTKVEVLIPLSESVN